MLLGSLPFDWSRMHNLESFCCPSEQSKGKDTELMQKGFVFIPSKILLIRFAGQCCLREHNKLMEHLQPEILIWFVDVNEHHGWELGQEDIFIVVSLAKAKGFLLRNPWSSNRFWLFESILQNIINQRILHSVCSYDSDDVRHEDGLMKIRLNLIMLLFSGLVCRNFHASKNIINIITEPFDVRR